mmetsp:Transcript_90020/g.178985  ORF Transcript_90020/g.178985 Transcript_90020/m.178985 type:complete len:280 (-) Transcript_90020:71-910(-)
MGHCCPKPKKDLHLPKGYQPPTSGPGFAGVPEPGHEFECWNEKLKPRLKMRLNALGTLEPVPELPSFSKGEPAAYPGHFNAGPFIKLPRSESTSTVASGRHAYTNIAVQHYNQAPEKHAEKQAYTNIVVPHYNQTLDDQASDNHAPEKKHAEKQAYTNIVVPHYNQAPEQYADGGGELTIHGSSSVTNQHQRSPSAPSDHNTRSLTVSELKMRGGRQEHSDAGKLLLPDSGTSWDTRQHADGLGRQDAMRAALHQDTQHSLQPRQSWTTDPFSEWRNHF